MENHNERIRKGIRMMANKPEIKQTVVCTVKSVDKTAGTMIAINTDNTALVYENVWLCAGGTYGIVIYPTVNSMILLGVVENNPSRSFVLMYSEIDEIHIKNDHFSIKATSDGIVFNEGNNGGLVVSEKVYSRLDALETKFNSLLNAFKLHNHSVNVSSASTVSLVPPCTLTSVTPVSDKTYFENEKIQH